MCSPSGSSEIASWLNFSFSSTMGSQKRPHGFMCVQLPSFPALGMSQAGLWVVSQTGHQLVLLFLPEKEKRSALVQVSLPSLPLWPPWDLGWLLGIMFSHGWTVHYSLVCELEARPFALTLKIEFSLSVSGLPLLKAAASYGGGAQTLTYLPMDRHWVFKRAIPSFWQLRWSWEEAGAIQLNTFNLGES